MIELYIENEAMHFEQNVRKLIEFCCSISHKLTFAVSMYSFLSDEITIAINDIYNEYLEDDKNRRCKYLTDSEYKINLLNLYNSDEEVMEYFDRLKKYDLIELENVKEELVLQLNEGTEDTKSLGDYKAISLPHESYLGSRFTVYSHCTLGGGIYKLFCFQIDEKLKDKLLEKSDLLAFYSYNNIDFLADPGFYYDDELICSICSHEQTTFLFLKEDQYMQFKQLGIPHTINAHKGLPT